MIKDAELDNRKMGTGWDFEFEIVDADGKEWEVYVDAKTGKVRDVSHEWFYAYPTRRRVRQCRLHPQSAQRGGAPEPQLSS